MLRSPWVRDLGPGELRMVKSIWFGEAVYADYAHTIRHREDYYQREHLRNQFNLD